ncbi:hypothetical protein SAMN05444162_1329 [Paenibacillaceae bacterium GAS479]|nr:hypothetical protein SAMN05444162_1329 [Paenibacillaceae bacterium GAS479]
MDKICIISFDETHSTEACRTAIKHQKALNIHKKKICALTKLLLFAANLPCSYNAARINLKSGKLPSDKPDIRDSRKCVAERLDPEW